MPDPHSHLAHSSNELGFNYDFDALVSTGKPNELNEVLLQLFHSPHSHNYAIFRDAQALIPVLGLVVSPCLESDVLNTDRGRCAFVIAFARQEAFPGGAHQDARHRAGDPVAEQGRPKRIRGWEKPRRQTRLAFCAAQGKRVRRRTGQSAVD